jgi:hypothetical protein
MPTTSGPTSVDHVDLQIDPVESGTHDQHRVMSEAEHTTEALSTRIGVARGSRDRMAKSPRV